MLLFASVETFGVSRMRDFILAVWIQQNIVYLFVSMVTSSVKRMPKYFEKFFPQKNQGKSFKKSTSYYSSQFG